MRPIFDYLHFNLVNFTNGFLIFNSLAYSMFVFKLQPFLMLLATLFVFVFATILVFYFGSNFLLIFVLRVIFEPLFILVFCFVGRHPHRLSYKLLHLTRHSKIHMYLCHLLTFAAKDIC